MTSLRAVPRSVAAVLLLLLLLALGCDPHLRGHDDSDAAAPAEERRASISDEIDLGAILERGRLAFREVDGRLEGGDRNYRAIVEAEGLTLIAYHGGVSGEEVRASRELALERARARVGQHALDDLGGAPVRTAEGGVVIERGWASERLANRASGLEQTWTFREGPRGAGPLVVRVGAPSLSLVAADEGGLHLAPAPGELGLVYGHGTWVEASGARTPIEARWVHGGVELEVPEEVLARTSWPAVLDPIIGPEVGPGVSTYVTGVYGAERQSDIAAGAGGSLVVWISDAGGTVRAARLGPGGDLRDPLGLLVSDAGSVVDTAVAYGGGVYLVAWTTGGRVLARRFDPSGAFLDAAPIEVRATASTYGVDATFDGTDFVLAWDEGPLHVRDLLFGRVGVDGTVREPGGRVLAAAANDQMEVALAVATGTVYAVWTDERRTGLGEVFGARIVGGVSLDPGGVLLAEGGAPAIAITGGTVTVAWRDYPQILVGSLDSATLTLAPAWTSMTYAGVRSAVIASAPSGHVVSWSVQGGDWRMVYAVGLDPSGAPLGVPFEVRRAEVLSFYGEDAVVDALVFDGTAYVATGIDVDPAGASSGDVYVMRLSPSGALESSTRVSRAPAAQLTPQVAESGGAYLLVWTVERGATDGLDLLGMRIAGDGAPIDTLPFDIETGSGHQVYAAVGGDGAGGWLVAWALQHEIGEATSGVYARTVAANGAVGARVEVDPDRYLGALEVAGGLSGYLVGYQRSREIRVRRVSPSGVVLDAMPIYPRTTGSTPEGFGMAFDGTQFHVVWTVPYPWRIDGSVVSSSGVVTPTGTLATEGGIGHRPVVAAGPESLLLGWTGSGAAVVRARILGVSGVPVTPSFDVATLTARSWWGERAVFEGTDYFVTYSPDGEALTGARITTSGIVRDPDGVVLVDAARDARLASTGDGRALLVYTRDEAGGTTRVVGARLIDFTRPGGDPNGTPCSSDWGCVSGFCADGFCCDAECGGGALDCQACAAAMGASADGACTVIAAGTECRAGSGVCDVAEVCDGSSVECPVDGFAAMGTRCGEVASDACDLDDTCTGSSAECITALRAPAGTVCRGAGGACDIEETCDGIDAACPADVLRPRGHVCRLAAGECDIAESCDGASAACPSDARVAAGVECRASAGTCDVAEACDGARAACPDDSMVATGTVCRAAIGACDREEACTGSRAACPDDERAPVRTICRAAAGACDTAEVCDGRSGACPPDRLEPVGAICRASAEACDAEERCDGERIDCPADAHREDGTSCDDGLYCNGASTCVAGACVDGSPVSCTEGEACVEEFDACEAAPVAPGGCGCRVARSDVAWPSSLALAFLLAVSRRRRARE